MSLTEIAKQLYFKTTGYSYTNLGRLFLRMFVGIMMMQFGIRQIVDFNSLASGFPTVLGMSPATTLYTLIIIEIACSLFVMTGFLTRIMTVPLFLAMMMAEYHLLSTTHEAPYLISWEQPGYLPVMFMGIYFFIMLVGPGKISVDYFFSLHLLHSENKNEEDLEEV